MRVSRQALEEIRQHLVSAYPNEGCGFLVGNEAGPATVGEPAEVTRQLPVANRREQGGAARTRYLISPKDFMDAEREAAAEGLQIVGTYHSHPDVAALPSTYDREHAWPWYRYLIVSVRRGMVREERLWQLADDRSAFVERTMHIQEEPWE
jgi:proteasome lid subunit RPN8/RPN11